MARKTEELNFKFYLVLININLNLSSYKWLVASVLESTDLEGQIKETDM